MAERRVLTVAEAAEQLRVTDQTIRAWLKSGKLKGTRPGGTKAGWRIPAAVVETQLELPVKETRRGTKKLAA